MEFSRDGCKFSIPDRLTVRQYFRYFSAASFRNQEDKLERYFDGARVIIEKWECAAMPELAKINIDELTQPSEFDVLFWAAMQVRDYVQSLEDVPKN